VDETALSYAEIKALCIGDPRIKEKMDLDIEVSRLKVAKTDYQNQKYKLEDAITIHYPRTIASTEKKIAGLMDDQERVKAETVPNKDGFSPMKIFNVTYTEKAKAGQALLNAFPALMRQPVEIGEYRGFKIDLSFCPVVKSITATLKGTMNYPVTLGNDIHGNITRLNNALEKIPAMIDAAEQQLESTKDAMEQAREEVKKPFMYEEQFQKQSARLAELDRELSIDANKPPEDSSEGDDFKIDVPELHEPDADRLELVADPAQAARYTDEETESETESELEPESDYDEQEYDEPGTEPNNLTSDEMIRQGLQARLEKDFGKLPPNITIGGISNHGISR
jgi:hypothetical protein